MTFYSRKLVTIVTEAVIEKEIIHELNDLGVPGYTIADVRGKGHRGVRNSEWEQGRNIRIEIVCDDALAEALTQRMVERYYKNYAMIIFIGDVSVIRHEKFKKEQS